MRSMFRYESGVTDDFTDNAGLALAARTTSCFPGVFPPVSPAGFAQAIGDAVSAGARALFPQLRAERRRPEQDLFHRRRRPRQQAVRLGDRRDRARSPGRVRGRPPHALHRTGPRRPRGEAGWRRPEDAPGCVGRDDDHPSLRADPRRPARRRGAQRAGRAHAGRDRDELRPRRRADRPRDSRRRARGQPTPGLAVGAVEHTDPRPGDPERGHGVLHLPAAEDQQRPRRLRPLGLRDLSVPGGLEPCRPRPQRSPRLGRDGRALRRPRTEGSDRLLRGPSSRGEGADRRSDREADRVPEGVRSRLPTPPASLRDRRLQLVVPLRGERRLPRAGRARPRQEDPLRQHRLPRRPRPAPTPGRARTHSGPSSCGNWSATPSPKPDCDGSSTPTAPTGPGMPATTRPASTPCSSRRRHSLPSNCARSRPRCSRSSSPSRPTGRRAVAATSSFATSGSRSGTSCSTRSRRSDRSERATGSRSSA